MHRLRIVIPVVLFVLTPSSLFAHVENETDAYKAQVPPGMELVQPTGKSAYKVVLPKGTAIRREGDLRIVEGTGEYAARRFMEIDAAIAKIMEDIAAIKNDIEEINKSLAELKKPKLVSK